MADALCLGFKIYEDGLTGTTWAVDKLITNKGKVNVTIPSCISDGNYLLRAELVALHSASSYPGAQFYVSCCPFAKPILLIFSLQMECAQINISGGDGSSSPSTVSFPGAYSGTNPGITFNVSFVTCHGFLRNMVVLIVVVIQQPNLIHNPWTLRLLM